MASSDVMVDLNQKALRLLQDDASKIEKLIAIQMENLATRKCPLYEEVLDTQMYGFSRAVDFAVRAGLVEDGAGRLLVSQLERNLAILYEAMAQKEEA
ncbi:MULTISPECIES: YlaN family protein [Cohnella]|uniref:YlaN family protein n=1 Tax=Cohnella TaxID=329857 RepID=UPI0009B96285|nr:MULTISPECIES: YlaN family protein [Cohnella]MBN2983463.1 YlaN family protein [Cohnella algarum]